MLLCCIVAAVSCESSMLRIVVLRVNYFDRKWPPALKTWPASSMQL